MYIVPLDHYGRKASPKTSMTHHLAVGMQLFSLYAFYFAEKRVDCVLWPQRFW